MYKSLQTTLLVVAAAVGSSAMTYVSTARWRREPFRPAPSFSSGSQVRWITLHDLERSLPQAPVSVVFDVDDTLLFSIPGFQWGMKTYGPGILRPGMIIRENDLKSEEDIRKFHAFWTRMNNELDEYSVKKWIAVELIGLHRRRGDRITFVTKRVKTPTEHLTDHLRQSFELPEASQTVFTDLKPKVEAFRQANAQICYGDSDTDIRDAIEAGARPIRVLRAPTSVNLDPVHNGGYGEEVLVNSES